GRGGARGAGKLRGAKDRTVPVRVASIGCRAMNIECSEPLVAGGASGLGEATVRRLHERGAVVTIADVNTEKGQALADELGVRFVLSDVREEDQVQGAVHAAAEADGGLRISVCCAGTGWAQRTTGSQGAHPLEPFATSSAMHLSG